MWIQLSFGFACQRDTWWKEPEYLEAVLAALDSAGLAFELPIVEATPRAKKGLTLRDAPAWIAAQRKRTSIEFRDQDDWVQATKLNFHMTPWPSFELTISGTHIDRLSADLPDRLIAALTSLRGRLPEDALLGPFSHLGVGGVTYPRLRPPRHFVEPCAVPAILDCFHTDAMSALPRWRGWQPYQDESLARAQALLAATLPRDVQRLQEGSLVCLKWAARVADESDVGRQLSLREQWMARHVPFALAADFNQLGDKRVELWNIQPHKQATFYHRGEEWAFKAVPLIRNEIDEEPLARLVGWKKAKRLGPDEPVSHVGLIVQSRQSALAVRGRALKLGIDRVVYTADDGSWWDPEPPGPWVDEPDPRLRP